MDQGHFKDMKQPERLRAAFLIRCWREGGQWRFVLENVATRKRQGFDRLEALVDFIRDNLVGQEHLD